MTGDNNSQYALNTTKQSRYSPHGGNTGTPYSRTSSRVMTSFSWSGAGTGLVFVWSSWPRPRLLAEAWLLAACCFMWDFTLLVFRSSETKQVVSWFYFFIISSLPPSVCASNRTDSPPNWPCPGSRSFLGSYSARIIIISVSFGLTSTHTHITRLVFVCFLICLSFISPSIMRGLCFTYFTRYCSPCLSRRSFVSFLSSSTPWKTIFVSHLPLLASPFLFSMSAPSFFFFNRQPLHSSNPLPVSLSRWQQRNLHRLLLCQVIVKSVMKVWVCRLWQKWRVQYLS